MAIYDFLKFLHVLAVVFMAIPLFNLIVVNERVSLGPAHLQVDQYFENIIRGGAKRCYVFQLTALVTGTWLAGLMGPWDALVTNPVLLAKLILLLALTALLSVVHFSLQPRIDGLLAQVEGQAIPPEIAGRIAPLRLKRKRLAAICLFLVVVTILLGLQVGLRFPAWLTVALIGLAALFAWRVYSSRILYGWI
jgi:uncharacterized membrane protein